MRVLSVHPRVPTRPGDRVAGWTWDDYATLGEMPCELIDGILTRVPTPVPRHQRICGEIGIELRQALGPRGHVYLPAPGVRLGDSEINPDLVLLLPPFQPRLTPKRIVGAPDLVVEVLSENRHQDEVVKRDLYQRHSVGEYWLADPLSNGVTILVLVDGVYQEVERSRVLPELDLFRISAWIARA